ncbi:MAG: T9SS type A sorting domain-containing protein, partial [Cyclobacteriaceae bacterium]
VLNPEEPTLPNIEWSSNNPAIATVDENGLVTANADGPVVITARAEDGSEIESTFSLTVSGQQTVTSLEDEVPFRISPNPSNTGIFRVTGTTPGTQLAVYDLNGRLVLSQEIQDPIVTIHIPRQGMYLVRMENGEYTKTHKLIVK